MNAPLSVLLFLLVSAFPTLAAGQDGQVLVTVRDESGRPLAGAQVRMQGLNLGGITDEEGSLRIDGVAPGPQTIAVRLLGYGPASSSATVWSARVTDVELALRRAPIPLHPMRVVARPGALLRHGFFRRQEGGVGTFLTRADIEKIQPRNLSDVLRRVPGLSVTTGRTGAAARSRGAGRSCPIQYYLDGVPVPAYNVDGMNPAGVEGLEIYRGAASIPPEYNRGTALCGVILIWTRID